MIDVKNVACVIEAYEVYQASIIQVSLDNISKEPLGACRQREIGIMIRHSGKKTEAFREVLRQVDT